MDVMAIDYEYPADSIDRWCFKISQGVQFLHYQPTYVHHSSRYRSENERADQFPYFYKSPSPAKYQVSTISIYINLKNS